MSNLFEHFGEGHQTSLAIGFDDDGDKALQTIAKQRKVALTQGQGDMVTRASATIHAGHGLSLAAYRANNLLLANAYPNLLTHESHVMDLNELHSGLVLGSSNNTRHLRSTIRQLQTTIVEWDVISEGGTKQSLTDVQFLSRATYTRAGRKAYIEYSYDPVMRKMLYEPTLPIYLRIEEQRLWTSRASHVLWEMASRYVPPREESTHFEVLTRPFHVDSIRRIFGAKSKTFDRFALLSQRVIKPACEDLSSHLDYDIEPVFQRAQNSNKVNAVQFLITGKGRQQMQLIR